MTAALAKLYTRKELLLAARQQGVSASSRLLDDWIQWGLLDHPVKRGQGRGKGMRAGWSQSQYRLWLALLHHRPRVGKLAALCNVPVGLWLYCGDAYATLAQVRRATATWARAYGTTNWDGAQRQSRRLLAVLARGRRRRGLCPLTEERLASALNKGIRQPAQTLRDEVLRAVGRNPLGDSTDFLDPTVQLDVLMARMEAARRAHALPDGWYHWARVFLLTGLDGLQRDYPQLVQEYPQLAPNGGAPPTFETLLADACRDLLTVLGFGLLWPDSAPSDQPLLQPAFWATGRAASNVSASPYVSPVLLPNGQHPVTGVTMQVTAVVEPSRPGGEMVSSPSLHAQVGDRRF